MGGMVVSLNLNFSKNIIWYFLMTYRLSTRSPADARASDSESMQPKLKIFFVVEGAETESIYLNSFISKFENKAIGKFIVLNRLDRSKSHQKAVTLQIESFIKACKDLDPQHISILNDFIEILKSPLLNESELEQTLLNLKQSPIPKNILDLLILDNSKESILHIYALESIITLQSYEKDFDKVCILIDRDKQSFKENQYDDVLKICEINNFKLGISNPSFELFLFLHFNNLLEYDNTKILENKKISTSKKAPKYMEKILKDYLHQNLSLSFNKNNYDADKFVSQFHNVSENISVSGLSTCIVELKNCIGTSVYETLFPLIDN